jgi:hypothetical protein
MGSVIVVLLSVLTFAIACVSRAFSSALARVLADDLKAWIPKVCGRLLDVAVGILPEQLRDRYREEWSGHVQEWPGSIAPVVVSLSLIRAAALMRWTGIQNHVREVDDLLNALSRDTAFLEKLSDEFSKSDNSCLNDVTWLSMAGAAGLAVPESRWTVFPTSSNFSPAQFTLRALRERGNGEIYLEAHVPYTTDLTIGVSRQTLREYPEAAALMHDAKCMNERDESGPYDMDFVKVQRIDGMVVLEAVVDRDTREVKSAQYNWWGREERQRLGLAI